MLQDIENQDEAKEKKGDEEEKKGNEGGDNGENVGLEYITGVKKRKELSEAEESEKKKFCSK